MCLTNLKKVIGHLNMANGEKIPRLGKASSLQVMKSWLEILDTSGSRWAYWSIPQKKLTEIFHKYKISECTGLTPPYERSKTACKTFLEASTHLLAQLDLDQSIRGWAGGETAPWGMEEVLKAFLSQEQTGVKDLIVIKSKKLLSMLSFLNRHWPRLFSRPTRGISLLIIWHSRHRGGS